MIIDIKRCLRRIVFGVFCLSLGPLLSPAHGLLPGEVLVLVNANVKAGEDLARYYMKKRGIPRQNILALEVSPRETLSRADYERFVIPPLRRALEKNSNIRALVTFYGLPLKIAPEGFTVSLPWQSAAARLDADTSASFDSELSLVLHEGEYSLNAWIPNPYYIGSVDGTRVPKSRVRMVSRLDAPTPDLVRRIIDDTLHAEKKGLKGLAYLDARWPDPGKGRLDGYAYYDRSLHRLAKRYKKQETLPVILDQSKDVFFPGSCPRAALYCGWYSLEKYVDAFQWERGSVGYHMASAECVTLKQPDSGGWCKNMLEKGVAATMGPVSEPYIQAFPLPDVFFTYLVEGYLSLVETYWVSLPYLSWKMVLIGDPLYRLKLL